MNESEFLALLEKKSGILAEVCSKTGELGSLIRSNDFGKISAADSAREALIKELLETDVELSGFKNLNREISEKAGDRMKNINSSLDYLIKLEKENETLLELAQRSFSGEYISAYKTYKQPK